MDAAGRLLVAAHPVLRLVLVLTAAAMGTRHL
jgi:hypothetical protein